MTTTSAVQTTTYFQARLCRHGTTDQDACVGYGGHYADVASAREVARKCNLSIGGVGLFVAVFECDARTDRAIRVVP